MTNDRTRYMYERFFSIKQTIENSTLFGITRNLNANVKEPILVTKEVRALDSATETI